MTTTQLFVELLVNGVGVLIWLLLLTATVFGFVPQLATLNNFNIFMITPFLAIAYVFGVIIDRISYGFFYKINQTIKIDVFGENINPSIDDRERYILHSSDALKSNITYNRSRIRICRSWIVNFALIAIFYATWQARVTLFTIIHTCVLFAIIFSFAILAFVAWKKLTRDHYKNIKSAYLFLRNGTSNNGNSQQLNQGDGV